MEKNNKPFNVWDKDVPPEESCYVSAEPPALQPPSDNRSSSKPTLVDLFCGAGGFAEGFKMAGFQSVLGLDYHEPSIKTFAHNHPTAATILGDVRQVDESLMSQALKGLKRVDVITAGVPCQGFSLNNRKRHSNDKRNFLFKEFIRIVKFLKPKVVLLENVSGLVSTKDGAFVNKITGEMRRAGYKVDYMVLNAADFGVPQIRKRVFFLGVEEGLLIRWPAPTHGVDGHKHVTSWDAIGDLPEVESAGAADAYRQPAKTRYQKSMRGSCKSLTNHEAPSHPQETIDKIKNTKPGEPMYPKFKQRIRLHPDKPSPTQVCGGIRPQFQLGHPTQARGLTIRERARLQSFPDDYLFHGGIVQGRVQTGNAVPPLLAKAVAQQIMSILNGQPPKKSTFQKANFQLELPI